MDNTREILAGLTSLASWREDPMVWYRYTGQGLTRIYSGSSIDVSGDKNCWNLLKSPWFQQFLSPETSIDEPEYILVNPCPVYLYHLKRDRMYHKEWMLTQVGLNWWVPQSRACRSQMTIYHQPSRATSGAPQPTMSNHGITWVH
jgi:hypothetical protein